MVNTKYRIQNTKYKIYSKAPMTGLRGAPATVAPQSHI